MRASTSNGTFSGLFKPEKYRTMPLLPGKRFLFAVEGHRFVVYILTLNAFYICCFYDYPCHLCSVTRKLRDSADVSPSNLE